MKCWETVLAAAAENRRTNGTWPNAATAMVFAAVIVVILLTFQDYGISWDEELHVAYGHKLLAYYTSGFADLSAFSYINLYQYGGFFDLLAAVAANISPFGEYETRHLVGGLMMTAGLFGAWRLTRLLAGDRAALIAIVCLATTPVLYGHSFINPKDAPLAWLGVWVAYYACRALGEERTSWRTIVGLGVSLGLALGTRIIAFAFVAQIGAILFVKVVAHIEGKLDVDENVRKIARASRPFLLAGPIAFVVMAVMWPWAVQSPFNIISLFQGSANQFWHPWMLWAGEMINARDLPRSYLLVLLAVKLPEYVLFGTAVILAVGVVRGVHWRRATFREPRTLQYLFVASTVIVPLAAFALLRPSTYNGFRHFLFIVPQLVILAAIGLNHIIDALSRRWRAAALAFAALFAMAIVREVIVMARVHPYQEVAFNTLTGGLNGAYGRFELDYWGTSYAEAVRALTRVIAAERVAGRRPEVKPRLFVCGANTSAGYYLPDFIGITEDRAAADFFLGGDLTNPRCRVRLEGPAIVEVKREGAVLSYVLDLRKAQP